MAITVTGPNGVRIDFPDGTDAATIQGVMAQATGGKAPAPQMGMLESFGRGAVEGATFGFDDKLGMDKSKREASKQANPWTHFAGEIAGGLLPAVATGGAGAAVAGSRTIGGRVAQQALRPFVAAETASIPQAVVQGMKLGGSYGALSGAGHAEDGEMATGAAKGLAQGAIVGGMLAPIASKVGEKIAIARAAKTEMGNADTASIAAIDRALARDRIDPTILRGQIEVPKYGKLTTDDITKAATLASEGKSTAEIAQALGTTEGTVRGAISRFEAQNATPLSVVDRARLTSPAGGENTSWTLRAGMASPGEGRAVAAETLTQRQMGQAGRISNIADDLVSAGNPAKRAAAMKDAEDLAYGAARSAEQPFDLAPMIQGVEARYGNRATGIAKEMKDAAGYFSDRPGFNPLKSLEHFQEAKIDLDYKIASSLDNMGRATPLTKRLMEFKTQLMDEVSRTNPQWRKANDLFAENATARRLFKDVETTGFRLTPESKQELASIAQAHKTLKSRNVAPEAKAAAQAQIEMAKDGMAEAVRMLVANKGEKQDHVSKMLTPAAQQMFKTILGTKDGEAFIKALRAEDAITGTYRGLGGSQTTPLKEAINEMNGPALLASAWDMANPRKLIDALVAKGAAKLSEARNNRMVPMLVESDPIKQLGMLRSVETMRKARTTGGNRGMIAVPSASNAILDQGRPQGAR